MAAAHRTDGLQAVRFPRAEELAPLLDMRTAPDGVHDSAPARITHDPLEHLGAEPDSMPWPGPAQGFPTLPSPDAAANGDRFFIPLPAGTDVLAVDEHALSFDTVPIPPGRLRLAAELHAARTVAERARIVSGLMSLMGFSSLTYALTEQHEGTAPTVAMIRNYVTPRFAQRYCEERLFAVDPRLP